MSEIGEEVGIILSDANTREATCQLLEKAERDHGGIREGMLLMISADEGKRKILARVGEIVPYHAFFTEGSAFSEAIRKKLRLPEEIARQYEICKLDILMEVPGGREVNVPPHPGDMVYRIDPQKQIEAIFGVKRDQKGIIWYGSMAGYEGAPVPLDVEGIPMHVAVFGVTGKGKSFDFGALIEKLCGIPTGKEDIGLISFPMIIIDAHGDYVNYASYLYHEKKKQREEGKPFANPLGAVTEIVRYVFPESYRAMESSEEKEYIKQISINLNKLNDRELAELIVLYYRGQIGPEQELQVSGIENALATTRELGYPWRDNKHEIFTNDNYFDQFKDYIERTTLTTATKGAIGRALDKFKKIEEDYHIFSTSSPLKEDKFIDELTRRGSIIIIDFSADGAPGVELPVKQIVMSYLAAILFSKFTEYRIKKQPRYLLFAIEESQNYVPDPSYPVALSLAKSKISAIATQGRKFGLGLCLISQRPSFVDRVVLSMCNTFFIHGISPEDISFVKSVTGGLPLALVARLTKLDKGEMIITGQMSKVPFPLVVKVPEKIPHEHGRKVPHETGKTEVVDSLTNLRR
jgi:DNA helicase HerA-like ATPase